MPRKSAIEYVSHNNSTVRIQRDGEDVQVITNNRLHVTFTAGERKNFLNVSESSREKVRQVAALIIDDPSTYDVDELCDEIDLL